MADNRERAHALYHCQVFHARRRPFRHAFRYHVWSLLLDLRHLDDLPRPLTHNRPGLISFHDRDHGPRDGTSLLPWVEGMLATQGVRLDGGPILLFCMPRLLGYAFNPLSVYYGFGPDGGLRGVVYEVKNTFGDQHCYVLPTPGGRLDHAQAKEFHVSPFFDIDGQYRFALSLPGERLRIDIRYGDKDGELLRATQTGRRLPLTTANLWRSIWQQPLLALQVLAGIHWQALKLWRKGARFHRRPEPPVRRPALAE